jgi:hypothetical protein
MNGGRGAYSVLWGQLGEEDRSEDLDVEVRIKLKWIFQK